MLSILQNGLQSCNFFFLLAVDCYFFENENIIIHMKYLSESNLCPTSLLA